MIKRFDVKYCLDIARDARLNEKELKEKYDNVTFIDDDTTDTQCFVALKEDNISSKKKTMLVSFRGTQQPKDWLTDFNAWHTVIPYGNFESNIRVHQGFLRCYKSVRGSILSLIAKHRIDINSIFVIGHSLGGALATLCAVDIQYNYPKIDLHAYVSGSPKVGNKAFAKSYNKRVPDTTRTYMRRDVVPKMPPFWFLKRISGGFKHVNKGYAIGPNSFWEGIKFFFSTSKTNFAANLSNHSIELYEK